MDAAAAAKSLDWLNAALDVKNYKVLNEEISFVEYMSLCRENPRIPRSAYQRIFDMIMAKGTSQVKEYRKSYTHYNFFDDKEIPIFGLTEALDMLVKFIQGAAGYYGPEKRVLLLHGPVGSSKSTICRLLKKGMEEYSRKAAGAWYTYRWVGLPPEVYVQAEDESPMHDEPLKLLPPTIRDKFLAELNETLRDSVPEAERTNQYQMRLTGDLNPRCRKFMNLLMRKYDGDWLKVLQDHVRVVRKVYSEADRIGIGTFQPKDEKNQDSTELNGDINFRMLTHFGTDSDPRAFSFDGEFNVANRGFVEFVEVLKLDVAFLYDLLGASQERKVKPKKFAQTDIDEMIIGHTNPPEFEKLQGNPMMEALKDRTIKIDIPYVLKHSDELKILLHDYGPEKVHRHIAPHTLEIAALWAILTRLEDDKDQKLSLVDKAKLYDGKYISGYTEDSVKELRDKHPTEGMKGMSVRFIQDKIANCLSSSRHPFVSPFMLLNELSDGLENSPLLTNKDAIMRYKQCCDLVVKELDEILKDEVQKALCHDDSVIERQHENYLDNVDAYLNKAKVKNKITGKDQAPDERLMRSIEAKIGVPEAGVNDFRRSIFTGAAAKMRRGEKFTWDSDPLLMKAHKAKLFEEIRDTIKLSQIGGGNMVNADTQEKINDLKSRLIKQYGYTSESAGDVLEYVGSIFARGESAEDE